MPKTTCPSFVFVVMLMTAKTFFCLSLFATEPTPEKLEQARVLMDLALNPKSPMTERRVEYRYQITALRELFDSFSKRFARFKGANVFDRKLNALRCGPLLKVESYRRSTDPDGRETIDCLCTLQNAGVLVRLGFSEMNEVNSIWVLPRSDQPAPEFMTPRGYYRHLDHFYSLIFLTVHGDRPPESKIIDHDQVRPDTVSTSDGELDATRENLHGNIMANPEGSRDRRLAERFMDDVLNSRTRYSGVFENVHGLNGRWKHDVDQLGNLFKKFSNEMSRFEGKNLVRRGNALRCGKLLQVYDFENYRHFDGTEMVQCKARMEYAVVIVRLAFDPEEDKVAAILVQRDPTMPTPEFFPKNGYHENIDPVPTPDRRHRIVANVARKASRTKTPENLADATERMIVSPVDSSAAMVPAFALLLKQADRPLQQPHRWKKPGEMQRWQDPATDIWWEPFEPSTVYEARRISWQNGSPYNESGSFSREGRFRWGRLSPGRYRVVACSCNPAMTYLSQHFGSVDFSTFLGGGIDVAVHSSLETRTEIVFEGDIERKLSILDAETDEAIFGYFSVRLQAEGLPEAIRFDAHLDIAEKHPFSVRGLSETSYDLFVRKIRGSMTEAKRESYRYRFDLSGEQKNKAVEKQGHWIIPLPRPHDGTPPEKSS